MRAPVDEDRLPGHRFRAGEIGHRIGDLQEAVTAMSANAQSERLVDLSLNALQNTAEYFLRVENMRFTIKQNAFLTFKNGDPYRLYYAPYSQQILSVEWLRDDNPFVEVAPDAAEDSEADSATDALTESRQQTQPRSR